jgi:tetratricopeptide (TPR) repeat protein
MGDESQRNNSPMRPEDEKVATPEEYIGRIMDVDGTPHRVEAILAIGSKYVVFDLRDLEDGAIGHVLKVLRDEFDPARPLRAAIPEAALELDQDPDRLLAICNRLLELNPKDETAAFNQGVAFVAKNQIAQALSSFNLAVSLTPADPWNLIQRASCCARLGHDAECLRDMVTASEHSLAELSECLRQAPKHAALIRQSLEQVARDEPATSESRRVLRDLFGPTTYMNRIK